MSSEAHGMPLADDEALRLEHVGKSYRIYDKPQHRLWQVFRRDRQWFREFLALDDISFSVRRGEVLGIVGRNGSGKSTLLQVISGILRPTSGSVSVRGRIAALLELGAGFNPEFSGIENVFLNGAILGLERGEIERRLPAILEFADIGDFVHRPVKTYSSGMFVRLAFSVAACVDPDVLIIDEALAVGDVKFQSKCFRRFDELVKAGKTILFVSHSTEQVVRHCTRALLLEGGRLLEDGEPRTVANRYLDLLLGADTQRARVDNRPRLRSAGGAAKPLAAAPAQPQPSLPQPAPAPVAQDVSSDHVLEERPGYCRTEYRWGGGGAELYDAELIAAGAVEHGTRLQVGETATICVRARFERDCERAIIGFFVKTPDGVTVYGNNTRNLVPQPLARRAGDELVVSFGIETHLGMGSYLLSLGVAEERNGEIVPLDRRYDVLQFEVIGPPGAVGLTQLYATCQVST